MPKAKAIADAQAHAVARGTPVSELLCYGYCDSVVFRVISYVAEGWPRYSGCISYPVPHPRMEADEGFYYSQDQLWEMDTYGVARRELLAYLIEELTKLTAVTQVYKH